MKNHIKFLLLGLVISALPQTISAQFRFAHISDTHGFTNCIDAVNDYAQSNPCDFAIISGDVVPNKVMIEKLKAAKIPYLIIPGNHDSVEGLCQFGFRRALLNEIDNGAIYGDEYDNYWYRDFEKDGKTLRVIGLDQFELDKINAVTLKYGWRGYVSQEQINWFIDVLSKSAQVDGLIIVIHMGFGYEKKGLRNTENPGKFVSKLADTFNNGYDFYPPCDPYMIPEIVQAYMTGENIKGKEYPGYNGEKLIVTTNFKKGAKNFISYYGGHLHWDEIEYLKDFPDQLQSLIAFCGIGTGSRWNDLKKTTTGEDSYNFNLNTIDPDKKTLTVERFGAKTTLSGEIRDSVKFRY